MNDEFWAKHVNATRSLYRNLDADPMMLRKAMLIAFGVIEDPNKNSLAGEYKKKW